MSKVRSIAILGAGFSGTALAVNLLRFARDPTHIDLIEREPRQFARGVAYSTDMDCHLLNVPAGQMSALPDIPDHFLDWALQRTHAIEHPTWVRGVDRSSFLPRKVYGEYLRWTLGEAERSARPDVRLGRTIGEATGARLRGESIELRLADGRVLTADHLILAFGNFRPGDPPLSPPSLCSSPRYHRDPWRPGLLGEMLQTDACLLIGSGLMMIDWVLSLSQAGYAGRIHVVSRRGQWPRSHAPSHGFELPPPNAEPMRILGWLHWAREMLHRHPDDWRDLVDAMRPQAQRIWGALPTAEKRRFLRHLRPFWDSLRHRLPPVVAERVNVLERSGKLCRHVGRIAQYHEHASAADIVLRERPNDRVTSLRVGAVLNCSGPESNYRALHSPLVCDLITQGIAAADELRLGLRVDADGRLIGASAEPSRRIHTIGPPQKGRLWETTAVAEIRDQAVSLAARLIDEP
ncbi:MAG: FAD/NAD(P)-binding protein [Methylotetracoccus sp.]